MSFPPTSPPDEPHSGQGGGFGPPPGGFGPPQYQPQPQYQPLPPYQNQQQFPIPPQQGGGYGYPPPQQGGGYGYPPPQQGGGYGYPPPPPPPPRRSGAKVAALAIGAVVLAAVVVGGLAVALGGGNDDQDATGSTGGSPTASTPAGRDTATASTQPYPSETFRKYVVLKPGQCFDDPGLDSGVTEVTTVSCDGPHDAEVIANETITGSFATEAELRTKVLKLCEADAAKRLKDLKNNTGYFYYALYPKLTGYQVQGTDTVSCSLTLSNKLDGKKLTEPLK